MKFNIVNVFGNCSICLQMNGDVIDAVGVKLTCMHIYNYSGPECFMFTLGGSKFWQPPFLLK